MTAEQGVVVFFSYARRDKMLRDRLEEHLSNLKYRGLIQTWHDQDILAGSNWLEQVDISLRTSQIILLLISSTFMASDYCYGIEMQQALQLHMQEKATVIPILLRPVLYVGAPFARLSMLPTNGKPVTSWRDRDSAFVDVALNIEKVARYYLQKRTAKQPILSSESQSLSLDMPGEREAIFRGASCPYCKAEARQGEAFCLNCGNRLWPFPPSSPMITETIRRAYYTESVSVYERILSHTPENEEVLRGLGKALYGLARYDEALSAFRRALLSRETPAGYAGLGDILLKYNRYSEAVAAYDKAWQLDQDVTLDYPGFIHALREVGRADEADRMYIRGRDLGYFDDGMENM